MAGFHGDLCEWQRPGQSSGHWRSAGGQSSGSQTLGGARRAAAPLSGGPWTLDINFCTSEEEDEKIRKLEKGEIGGAMHVPSFLGFLFYLVSFS
jgi:hypothetical protein